MRLPSSLLGSGTPLRYSKAGEPMPRCEAILQHLEGRVDRTRARLPCPFRFLLDPLHQPVAVSRRLGQDREEGVTDLAATGAATGAVSPLLVVAVEAMTAPEARTGRGRGRAAPATATATAIFLERSPRFASGYPAPVFAESTAFSVVACAFEQGRDEGLRIRHILFHFPHAALVRIHIDISFRAPK